MIKISLYLFWKRDNEKNQTSVWEGSKSKEFSDSKVRVFFSCIVHSHNRRKNIAKPTSKSWLELKADLVLSVSLLPHFILKLPFLKCKDYSHKIFRNLARMFDLNSRKLFQHQKDDLKSSSLLLKILLNKKATSQKCFIFPCLKGCACGNVVKVEDKIKISLADLFRILTRFSGMKMITPHSELQTQTAKMK